MTFSHGPETHCPACGQALPLIDRGTLDVAIARDSYVYDSVSDTWVIVPVDPDASHPVTGTR